VVCNTTEVNCPAVAGETEEADADADADADAELGAVGVDAGADADVETEVPCPPEHAHNTAATNPRQPSAKGRAAITSTLQECQAQRVMSRRKTSDQTHVGTPG
jgi:hypothetical protein